MMKKRVAVVGAGVAGLVSTKICLEENLDVVCFEMTSDIGGLWNYSDLLVKDRGSVMKSTIINSSKENLAFSDFPPPTTFANFMHNKKLLQYFRLYASKFKLIERIKFNTKVIQILKAGGYEETGQWKVVYEENKIVCMEIFDAVMVCNGHHWSPHIPIINTLNDSNSKFKVEIIHSWEYREPFKYVDKRVIVIGVGDSGIDIAVELSRFASQVYLSTRHGVWCCSRLIDSLPLDYVTITRFNETLKTCLPFLYKKLVYDKIIHEDDHELYALKPDDKLLRHISDNDELRNRISSGTLIMKPNVKKFDAKSCEFDDGTVADNIDLVVLATGYNIEFPFLDNEIIPVKDNWVNLYKFVFPAHLRHSTLAVIGCVQPLSAKIPIMEMQSRWATRVFKSLCQLPSEECMRNDIRKTLNEINKRFSASHRHTIEVDYLPYLDEISSFIGCKPDLKKYFFSDFNLWRVLYFHGVTPYQYRLNGPGSDFKSAKANILNQRNRVLKPFKTRPIKKKKIESNKYFLYLIISSIVFCLFATKYF